MVLVSPGAFVAASLVRRYKWGGWLWADREDGAAWWKVVTQGPYYSRDYHHWWGLRAYAGGSWAFLVAMGLIGGVETSLYLKTMAVYTLFIGGLYGECCWKILWNDHCTALTTGIFTLPRLVQEGEGDGSETEAENVTDNEDNGDDTTGHVKTE